MASAFPFALSLPTRMSDPHVYVAFGPPQIFRERWLGNYSTLRLALNRAPLGYARVSAKDEDHTVDLIRTGYVIPYSSTLLRSK